MKQKLRSSVPYELATQQKKHYGSRETNMYIKPKNFTPWYLNAALCFLYFILEKMLLTE